MKLISASSPINPKQQKRRSSYNPKNRRGNVRCFNKRDSGTGVKKKVVQIHERGGVGAIRHRWDTFGLRVKGS